LVKKVASWIVFPMALLWLSACSTPPGIDSAAGEEIGTQYPVRWFPRSVRFSPDDSHLLVSLCHFEYAYYCRVARYWIADSRWEVLPHERGVSMAWPEYSPDGKRIVYAQAKCPNVFRCVGAEFALSTMNRDGGDRRELGPTAVQMPTHSPDGSRLLYWKVQGSSKLSSGRATGSWGLYEYSLNANVSVEPEARITDEVYYGIYAAPRYLPGGERLLYTAYRSDGEANHTFVVRRDEGLRRTSNPPRPPIAPWAGANTQFIHAFHARRGWLVGYKVLWFQPENPNEPRLEILNSAPFTTPVADVSHNGEWVVALSGISAGTMRDAGGGGAVDYWNRPSIAYEGRPPVPVMTLTAIDKQVIQPIVDWPPDVERVTRPQPAR
jgi:WD40-like Beta Propeller Repeat